MKIININLKRNFTALVLGLHGSEQFCKYAFDKIIEGNNYDNVKVILAHEEALMENKRFFETDLNRSFPGSKKGSFEEKLAYKILQELKGAKIVLDIHTTTSRSKKTNMFPIITSLNKEIKEIISAIPIKTPIVHIKSDKKSLIENVKIGISLEFNDLFALKGEAMPIINQLIYNINNKRRVPPSLREIYFVSKSIPKKLSLPKNTENFKYSKKLKCYPVLLGEKYYEDIHGFAANKKGALKF